MFGRTLLSRVAVRLADTMSPPTGEYEASMSALSLLPQQNSTSAPNSLLPTLLVPPTMSGWAGVNPTSSWGVLGSSSSPTPVSSSSSSQTTIPWGILGSNMLPSSSSSSSQAQASLSALMPTMVMNMMSSDASVETQAPQQSTAQFYSSLTPLSFDGQLLSVDGDGSDLHRVMDAVAGVLGESASVEMRQSSSTVAVSEEIRVVPVSTRPVWKSRSSSKSSSSGRILGSSGTEAETPFAFLVTQKLLTPLLSMPARRQQQQQQQPIQSNPDSMQ